MPDPAVLHPVSREHLSVLSDRVGILQHAIGSRPDPAHGYCVDDVARALQVDLLHGRALGWAAVADSAWRSFRYLDDAFDAPSGRFRNFRSIDGTWDGGPGSEDSYGRAMLALGEVIAGSPESRLADAAMALFLRALPATKRFVYPRAEASVVLGCAAIVDLAPDGPPA
ncbi:MAG: glycosyl transferase family 1, partial [Candidatus Limnocylindrales bacterium]